MQANDPEKKLLDELFTAVIGFNGKGEIFFTSNLVNKCLGYSTITNINQIIGFIRPNMEMSGYTKAEIGFFQENKRSPFIFNLGKNFYPIRAQFIQSKMNQEHFYLVGMPWLAKLQEQDSSNQVKLMDFPLFDSQIDMLTILDYQEKNLDELEKTTKSLQEAKIAHEMANREKSNLLSMISHEMKTPLTSLVGAISLLERQLRNTLNDKLFNVISMACSNLLTQTNEILSFTSYEYGDSKIKPEVFSVHEMFDQINLLVGSNSKLSKLRIRINISFPQDTFFYADNKKIKNILLNFINNAIKHTEAGGIDVDVDVNNENNINYLKFSVKDSGRGIPADKIGDVFKPYWKSENIKSSGSTGTGFGLYLSKQLTEILCGECGVISIEGEGSTFWAKIPILYPDPEILHSQPHYDETAFSSFAKIAHTKKLLLVEDNKASREIVCEMLENLGFTVTACINGVDAVNALKGGIYDLVLMDLGMPIMDGYEAIREIRKKDSKDKLPVLAFSAFSELEDMDNLVNIGFNGFIHKPVSMEDLITTLNKFFRQDLEPRPLGQNSGDARPTQNKQLPYIDISTLAQLKLDTGKSELNMLLCPFLEELEKNAISINAAFESRDDELLRKQAHSLKGVCLLYGARPLSRLMKELELQASQSDPLVYERQNEVSALIDKTVISIKTVNVSQLV